MIFSAARVSHTADGREDAPGRRFLRGERITVGLSAPVVRATPLHRVPRAGAPWHGAHFSRVPEPPDIAQVLRPRVPTEVVRVQTEPARAAQGVARIDARTCWPRASGQCQHQPRRWVPLRERVPAADGVGPVLPTPDARAVLQRLLDPSPGFTRTSHKFPAHHRPVLALVLVTGGTQASRHDRSRTPAYRTWARRHPWGTPRRTVAPAGTPQRVRALSRLGREEGDTFGHVGPPEGLAEPGQFALCPAPSVYPNGRSSSSRLGPA